MAFDRIHSGTRCRVVAFARNPSGPILWPVERTDQTRSGHWGWQASWLPLCLARESFLDVDGELTVDVLFSLGQHRRVDQIPCFGSGCRSSNCVFSSVNIGGTDQNALDGWQTDRREGAVCSGCAGSAAFLSVSIGGPAMDTNTQQHHCHRLPAIGGAARSEKLPA